MLQILAVTVRKLGHTRSSVRQSILICNPVPPLWPCLVGLWPIVPDQLPSHTPDYVLLLLCCSCTFNSMFCVRRSSHVQTPHFQKRLQGATAVVLCGVVRYF